MMHSRRQDDRRRRVLMTTASVSAASPTASSRSRMEQLREARRPAVAYGSRVRKCLRGRWFSLVPVQRATVAKLFTVLSFIVLTLVALNDATARFAAFAERREFVHVFRILEYGSLGRYFIGVMYLGVAGAGWMVYQLRRFRNDDFGGNYRVWQWIVGLSLLSSVAQVVPVLTMLGGSIDWMMGKRIALSGQDWIGLFLTIGGAILAMRTVAEMWRYRSSMSLMVIGWLLTTIPIAVDWNILVPETNLRWTIVTSAPLLAVSFWFAATVTYLRTLYYEVRGLEPSAGFVRRFTETFTRRSETDGEDDSEATPPRPRDKDADDNSATSKNKSGKRRWFGLLGPAKPVDASRTAKPSKKQPAETKPSTAATTATKPSRDEARTSQTAEEADGSDKSKTSSGKRRWFGMRGPAKPAAEKNADEDGESDQTRTARQDEAATRAASTKKTMENDSEKAAKPKRSWLPSLRRKPKPDADEANEASSSDKPNVAAKTAAANMDADGDSTETPKKRRFGLGSMMRRKSNTDDESVSEADSAARQPPRNSSANGPTDNDDSSGDDGDDDDSMSLSDDGIDWSGMNKAERRRMRKQLKRGGRVA
ncbi:hypothetical protein [Aporhodopirellula aestuarii]|uniref:Uncharacterized protein n=1 Tax=Aporhodopirellula aestuarii TaxID=2950107 RepID=A0ABT0TZV3_9BACT|nr:hypothetical protein [Aporhodopirellula aestuarii]MCM2370110.1 hypothetical protein [Aporhodopirellula aestuarii]